MTYIATTLGELLSQLNQHSWKNWVFTSDPQNMDLKSRCLVVDTELAELAKDDFTPLIAEQEGLKEFLSIHDILDVREYLKNIGFVGNCKAELFAVQYYFDRDAYPTEADVLGKC